MSTSMHFQYDNESSRQTTMSKNTSFSIANNAKEPDKKSVTIYFRDPEYKSTTETNEQQKKFLLSLTVDGQRKQAVMQQKNPGIWSATLDIPANSNTEVFIFQNSWLEPNGKPVINGPPVINGDAMVLTDGKADPVIHNNPRAAKGVLKKYVYKEDGSIVGPISSVEETKNLEDGERFIRIHFPYGYNENKRPPYNLQVVLDGDEYLNVRHMDTQLDNLFDRKEIEPVVTVFISPCSPETRAQEYLCNENTAKNLAITLPTAMKEKFNINPTNITVTGFSFAGLQALFTASRYPDQVRNVIAQSPSLWYNPSNDADAKNNKLWGEETERGYLHTIVASGDSPKTPVNYCFQTGTAGDNEMRIHKATENFIPILEKKGHHVLTNKTHPAGHGTPLFLQLGYVDAARNIFSPGGPGKRIDPQKMANTIG